MSSSVEPECSLRSLVRRDSLLGASPSTVDFLIKHYQVNHQHSLRRFRQQNSAKHALRVKDEYFQHPEENSNQPAKNAAWACKRRGVRTTSFWTRRGQLSHSKITHQHNFVPQNIVLTRCSNSATEGLHRWSCWFSALRDIPPPESDRWKLVFRRKNVSQVQPNSPYLNFSHAVKIIIPPATKQLNLQRTNIIFFEKEPR